MEFKSFNFKEYNFEEILKKIFNVSELDLIHEKLLNSYDLFTVETDQDSEFHEEFYSKMYESGFIEEYERFMSNEIVKHYDCDILFQKTPTFRISYPGNVAVGGFHKDSDYNHNSKEKNYFLPLTDAFDTNTIWYESGGNYVPMNCQKGNYVIWDGANTMHGNKKNKTGKSRVSIDFRVLRLEHYNESSSKKKSITKSIKFDIGNYWKVLKNDS